MNREERRREQVLTNSIERLIDTTIEALARSKHPDAITASDDWKDLAFEVRRLWAIEQERIRKLEAFERNA